MILEVREHVSVNHLGMSECTINALIQRIQQEKRNQSI